MKPIHPKPLPAFEAILFDMDGVIVDSEPLHERAFREVFDQMGYGQTHGIHFPDYFGRSDSTLWRDFVDRHAPPQPFEELMAWKQRHFIQILKEAGPIFDGLPELVERLARRYRLALASGSPHPVIDEVLAMRGLRQYFPVVVSVQDVGKNKPAPDVFLRAAQLLGVKPAQACVIEDSAVGVEAGRAAGMTTVAITNTLAPEQLGHADRVVRTYDEIATLLL
jgi:HAD superfamily hydrolase (TIGR01509 family)